MGEKKSFLTYMKEENDKRVHAIREYLNDMFGEKEEYWLVNRLDNETTGLLYFAKTPLFKQRYKRQQQLDKVDKIYLATVYGKFPYDKRTVESPIWHHKFAKDRMVVIKKEIDKENVGWKLHYVHTDIEKLEYDEKENVTHLLITINKGIRHQIRCHLSSIGYPIVGEKIYIKKSSQEKLSLYSLGVKINSLF